MHDAEQTIRSFYEAALVPELWPQALDRLTDAAGSVLTLFQKVGADGHDAVVSRRGNGMLGEFVASGLAEGNPRMEGGMRLTRRGHRGLITEQMMMSREQWAQHPFWCDFVGRYDIDHEAGRLMASHAGSHFVLTIQRNARAGPYEGLELEALNKLSNQLSQACELALRAKQVEAQRTVEMFAQQGEAMALLSASGTSLFHTPAFEGLLADCLVLRGGRVHAKSPEQDRELQALMARAAHGPAEETGELHQVALRRPTGRPMIVRCYPILGTARDFLGFARMILLVDDLEREEPPATQALVSGAFGFTPAEARLAIHLAKGETLKDAADLEGITYETARSRLKIIFGKTATNRQHELALLIARLSR